MRALSEGSFRVCSDIVDVESRRGGNRNINHGVQGEFLSVGSKRHIRG